MNLERIILVTSCYLFLTGYQIHWYNRKSLRYYLSVGGLLYFLIISTLYFICFCHHFENSSLLKILLDMSPFLNNLVRVHVLLGLKVYVICILETKHLNKISNRLICIFKEEIKCQKRFDIFEVLTYLMFFATLMVIITVGLYVAIELEFELPPLDHIMIYMALFIPHFTLAGGLRLYTLGLWLITTELTSMQRIFMEQGNEVACILPDSVAVDIFNPAFKANTGEFALQRTYEKVSKRLDIIGEYVNMFDSMLQRQLGCLVGMNLNCLLAGIYTRLYFQNTWQMLFTNVNRRIFYASNSAIFVCILMDYSILLFTRWRFCRSKQNLYELFESRLFRSKQVNLEMETILKFITYKLSKDFKLRLFGLVKFNAWNFLMFHGLMISIITLIVNHQYIYDQINTLNEQLDASV